MKRKRNNKNFGWPHMFYEKATGDYLICEKLADVPEGFVERRQACDVKPVGVEEPSPYSGPELATASEEAVVDEDEDEDEEYETEAVIDEDEDDDGAEEEGDDGATDKPTLEGLEVSRTEAVKMLTEVGVAFRKNASDDTLAALIAKELEE